MAYARGFEEDIFFSYGHIDNEPVCSSEPWVEYFHVQLERRLAQLLGENVAIWRDAKLQGNDYLDDAIRERIAKAAVLISILSPRYLKSGYCRQELATFFDTAQQTGGVRVGNWSRVFKVVKTSVDREALPVELREILDYPFFEIDQDTKRLREFSIDPGDKEGYLKFRHKLDDVAQDICKLLEVFKSGREADPKATVYIAETTSDLDPARDNIRRELQQYGCVVLPDRPLSLNGAKFREDVRAFLTRCRMSIHLVGEMHAVVPEGEDDCSARIQLDLAGEQAALKPDGCRLVWISPDAKPKDSHQVALIDYIARDSCNQPRTEMIQGKLESVKTFVQAKLSQEPAKDKLPASDAAQPLVYLICDNRDIEAIAVLDEELFKRGFEVNRSALEGDESSLREWHKENLRECDSALIFWGAGNELWLRSKLLDLKKAPGYGRSKPMLGKGVYVSAPDTAEKARFRSNEACVIESSKPSQLESFMAQLKRAYER
ncbi:MAG: TIR domain-containing protein [Burkholderiales bacterium]